MIDPAIISFDWALRGGTVALLLLTAAALWRDHGRLVPARLGVLFALGSAAYAVCSAAGMQGQPHAWAVPLQAVSAGNNVVFWLFASALFDDDFRLRPWHGAVWLLMVGLGLAECFVGGPRALAIALTLSSLAFAGVALLQTVFSWRADLVEGRRRLRLFIVGASSLYIAITALSQLLDGPRVAPGGAITLVGATALLAIAGTVAWTLLRIGPRQSLFLPAEVAIAAAAASPPPAAPRPEPVDARLLAELEQTMIVQRAYRQDGLTIGALAQRLTLPEYKLRRLINQGLGYRNFNSFLNHYRINEAKAALADRTQTAVPILTIAMDTGFSSLGPFNRAFKAETGQTPSEYRRLNTGIGQPIPQSASWLRTRREEIWPLSRLLPHLQGEPFMNRTVSIAALATVPVLLTACGSLDRAMGVATGFVSHQLCSAAFVSRVEPETFYRESIAPSLGPAEFLVSHTVDRERASVTASVAGLRSSRAVYRGPQGCLVLRGDPPVPADQSPASTAPALLPPIAGPGVVEPADPALRAALDRAFEERPAPPLRQTKAIVVVRDGTVIAERYAPGYTMETELPGWSATKSVTNALVGILVRQGKVALHGPAPIAAWASPGDPRHAISIDNLLRMNSGLDCGQSLTAGARDAFDPSAHMVFGERDMAAFAANRPRRTAPGAEWIYTNCNTLLLSQVIRDNSGGDAASVMAFARRELFGKLDMQHVTLEFDAVGTPIGASHMFASARDWARFGLLYLDDGVVGGERLLPKGWVDYSAAMTPGSEEFGYAAGFWTNRGPGDGARYRVSRGMPADAFMARGAYGQYVVVVPSQRLVVARFGTALDGRNDMDGVARLVADVIALTPRPQAAKVRP